MEFRRPIATALLAVTLVAAPASAAKPPVEWDGLQRVASKRMDLVYVQPGADFRGYTKVIVEPTEVAFRKSWARDYNSSNRSLSQRVSDREVEETISAGIVAASDIFTKAWREGGYEIVSVPGPDVLRVRTGIVNISVSAPERQTSARTYSFSNEAGHATLVLEAKDSLTGALLGRVVDQQIAGDSTVGWRTRASNRSDFADVVETWAKDAVRGLGELKALSPAR
jgi:hypothetical protein